MIRVALIALIFLSLTTFGQTKQARKLGAYGDLGCDEFVAYLQNAAVEAAAEWPSTVFVIAYGGSKYTNFYSGPNRTLVKRSELPRFGELEAKIETMRARIYEGKYMPGLFIFVNGGFREKYTVEVWLVPEGANAPIPTPTFQTVQFRKGRARSYKCSV